MSGVAGGCRCGAVRFRSAVAPTFRAYCHCSDCKSATGAPVAAFVGIAADALEFNGELKRYASSSHVERAFCAECGSPIYYRDDRLPDQLYFYVGALDDPEAHAPEAHAWLEHQLPWLNIDDALPRHPTYSVDPERRGGS